jgi:hypothetical protein
VNTIVQGLVRGATLLMLNLLSATPATYAAEPPSNSPHFKPWIDGVSAGEPQMQV